VTTRLGGIAEYDQLLGTRPRLKPLALLFPCHRTHKKPRSRLPLRSTGFNTNNAVSFRRSANDKYVLDVRKFTSSICVYIRVHSQKSIKVDILIFAAVWKPFHVFGHGRMCFAESTARVSESNHGMAHYVHLHDKKPVIYATNQPGKSPYPTRYKTETPLPVPDTS
jgi:hypothetical protein